MSNKLISSALILACLSFPQQEKAHPLQPFPAAPKTWQQEMLDRVNEIRTEGCRCGRKKMRPSPPLRWNDNLAKAALSHAKDMDRKNFIGHKGSNGSKIGERVDRAGYNWQCVGENVAWNVSTVEGAILGWKDSPGHCMTMMSGGYTEMGAAHVGRYWVQVFAAPMGK